MFSIIVPAHNEEQRIGSCIEHMLAGADVADFEILVIANGCTDRSAQIAGAFGPPVRVIETPVASKSEALRLGDVAAKGFPRLYVDADVMTSAESIRRVVETLERGPALAAAPRMRVDLTDSSWAVRAYYDVWTRLPYHDAGMIGSGFYALSEAGRGRFDFFPKIISDDGFARLHFGPDERATVEDAEFRISAPSRLSGVLKIKTRSQKGAVQLHRLYPGLRVNDPRHYAGKLGAILAKPTMWPRAAVYLYVIALTKLRAYWLNYLGELDDWERDDTSRSTVSGASLPAAEKRTVE